MMQDLINSIQKKKKQENADESDASYSSDYACDRVRKAANRLSRIGPINTKLCELCNKMSHRVYFGMEAHKETCRSCQRKFVTAFSTLPRYRSKDDIEILLLEEQKEIRYNREIALNIASNKKLVMCRGKNIVFKNDLSQDIILGQVNGELGAGDFGSVFEVELENRNRIAIKCNREGRDGEFKQELRIMNFLKENNVINYPFQYSERHQIFTMPVFRYKTLLKYLNKLTVKSTAKALRSILKFVQQMHDVEVCHGDITTRNVFVADVEEGICIVFDYGRSVKKGDSLNIMEQRTYSEEDDLMSALLIANEIQRKSEGQIQAEVSKYIEGKALQRQTARNYLNVIEEFLAL